MTTQPNPSPPSENPFTDVAQAFCVAVLKAQRDKLSEEVMKDILVTGIEALRITAITVTLISLSDNRAYPNSSLRGTLTAMMTRSLQKMKGQIEKFKLLLEVVLPEA